MTKLQCYDQLEIDERPRICGGAVFLRLMKKGKCGSSAQKNNDNSPVDLTSSSSISSSQASSTTFSNMYDPSKTHFCMPRQIEGVGAAAAAAESKDRYKLDFELRAEERINFNFNNEIDHLNLFSKQKDENSFRVEDRAGSHSIVQFNPQVVNDLKTKHMQSINEKRAFGDDSRIDQSMNINQSIRSPRNGILEEEVNDTKENDVHNAWNNIENMSIKQIPNEEQRHYESKANVLRKEMTSFRKELNDVKESLPNQFHSTEFPESTIDERERSGFVRNGGNSLRRQKLSNQIDSGQCSGRDDAWDFDAFASDASKNQTQDHVGSDQNYFKNDWNLNFQDQNTTPTKKSSEHTNQRLTQKHENSSSVLEYNESFPECPEMPFDQGLNPEEIEINASSSPEEIESSDNFNLRNDGEKCASLFLQTRHESEKVESHKQESRKVESHKQRSGKVEAHSSDKRQNVEDSGVSAESNYEEDMELVRMLLRKYGENIDEKLRVDKARRMHAIIDAPTDAWFHRHAAGISRKPGKLSASKVAQEASPTPSQRKIIASTQSIPEKANYSQGTTAQSSSKKINRVHFKDPAVVETIKKPDTRLKSLGRTRDNTRHKSISPKLSDKVKFWEGNK